MSAIKTQSIENTIIEFNVDSLATIREKLTPIQKKIIDACWQYHLIYEKALPFRSAALICGKEGVPISMGWINPTLLHETNDQGIRAFQLNIYGALLSLNGRESAALLIRLLDFIKIRFIDDNHLTRLQSLDIKNGLELSLEELDKLFKLLRLHGLHSLPISLAGWAENGPWELSISDEIVDLYLSEDIKSFLDLHLDKIDTNLNKKSKRRTVMDYFTHTNLSNDIDDLPLSKVSYVSKARLAELKAINNTDYDCTRLIGLCNELNDCAARENVYSVAILTRVILDHIPPIFGFDTFAEVASNYRDNGKSFKKSAERLQSQTRLVADKFLHSVIRKKEVLPNMHEVSFSQELESVLSEVCRLLK